MAMVRNCVVHGIEPVNVKRKSDGKEFNFYKLHLIHDFPTYIKAADGVEGSAVLTCTVYPEVMEAEDITLGSMVDVFRKGNTVEFVRVC